MCVPQLWALLRPQPWPASVIAVESEVLRFRLDSVIVGSTPRPEPLLWSRPIIDSSVTSGGVARHQKAPVMLPELLTTVFYLLSLSTAGISG